VYNTNGDGDASSAPHAVNNLAMATVAGARSAWSSASTMFGSWPSTFASMAMPDSVFSIYATVALE
jgi:hypothetical protein